MDNDHNTPDALRPDDQPDLQEPTDEADLAAPAAPELKSLRDESVAEQIRRKVREEAAGAAPANPNFDFQMRMQAGGKEITDTAQSVEAETGKSYEPPPFSEGGWRIAAPEEG